ncbi:MAG: tRNA (adenosine(37)-N6)-dimethylallyltransferase MiaA [Desulfuromonadia bacterium]
MEGKQKIVVIVGPTASGKSSLAIRLATLLGGEVVSADSLQIYRGFDIGSAKPTPDERLGIPHHLMDIVDPDEEFSAADYVRRADEAIAGIVRRGGVPIVAGGTGLYVRTLLHGLVPSPGADPDFREEMNRIARQEGNEAVHRLLREVDPAAAASIHPNNLVRTIRALEVWHGAGRPISSFWRDHRFVDERYDALLLGISPPQEILAQRIKDRVGMMIERGLVEEVRGLLQQGYSPDLKPFGAIGYREVISLLAGEMSLSETVDLIVRNTRRYAKRQMTWFRRERSINWLEYPENFASIRSTVIQFIAQGVECHAKGAVQHPGSVSQSVEEGAGSGPVDPDVG